MVAKRLLRAVARRTVDQQVSPSPTTIQQNLAIEYASITSLRPSPRNARLHSEKQIRQIESSIAAFGFNDPILVDGTGEIIAGHGRFEAAKRLAIDLVPILRVQHLSQAAKRSYALAANKIALNSGWDHELLATELLELELSFPDLEITFDTMGFAASEVDSIVADFSDDLDDTAETLPPLQRIAITRAGNVWQLGRHRLICGDARDTQVFEHLMGTAQAAMVFTDPPYNVPINGHVKSRKQRKYREFIAASGEMSSPEFITFLGKTLGNAAAWSAEGSIHFVCMDWRSVADLIAAGQGMFSELKNICVWVKRNAGQGTFYRSQHEFVLVFKKGNQAHQNNFELGQHGRTRTNVWSYASGSPLRSADDEMALPHPTVKPVAMVVDALKDCSRRGDIVLDPFMGSGTTIMAAEQVGRRAFGIECDPLYVDLAVRRWQRATKADAVLLETGVTFDKMAAAIDRETVGSSSNGSA